MFAQHIRADGSEAFPHNGSAGSTNTLNVHVEPSVSYNAASDETFLFWTEEDSNQFTNGVSGQKFDGTGASLWSSTGLVIVPLGSDTQTFVENVQIGTGALVFWVDSPAYGQDTMQATQVGRKWQRHVRAVPRLVGSGKQVWVVGQDRPFGPGGRRMGGRSHWQQLDLHSKREPRLHTGANAVDFCQDELQRESLGGAPSRLFALRSASLFFNPLST